MLQDEDYDSDTSDEDFVPEGAESEDDPGSDNEVPEDQGIDDDEEDEEGGKKKSKSGKKVRKKKVSKKKNPLLADLEEPEESPLAKDDIQDEGTKGAAESDKKADNIWADFLADVEDKPPPPPKPKAKSWASLLGNKKGSSNSSSVAPAKTPSSEGPKKPPKTEESSTNSNTVKITKVFEFAGEEVRVEKEVDANSDEAKIALSTPTATASQGSPKGTKRPGGLSSIMGMIDNKKQKLTTLEKTKLDWNSFKKSEGIDEELESHKKSKDGFLDKQDFLERADLRQFELERAMRMNKRSNR